MNVYIYICILLYIYIGPSTVQYSYLARLCQFLIFYYVIHCLFAYVVYIYIFQLHIIIYIYVVVVKQIGLYTLHDRYPSYPFFSECNCHKKTSRGTDSFGHRF